MDMLLSSIGQLLPVWNATRAAGLTSYFLLFISMMAGMLQTRGLHPKTKAILNVVHQSSGWFGLLFGMFHGLVLMYDQDVSLSLKEILIPFLSHTDTLEMGVGILALYLMALVIITSDLMKVLGRKIWKTIHFLAFPAYLLALYHGITMGPDTSQLGVTVMYVVTAGMVLTLFMIRIFSVKKQNRKQVTSN